MVSKVCVPTQERGNEGYFQNRNPVLLLMNFDLMKAGFLPVIFQVTERLAYYEALDKAHIQNDYRDFLQLSVAAEIKAFETVLSLLR